MQELHDVVLHVWELQTTDQVEQATSPIGGGGGMVSFFTKLLPKIGYGAYHSCIEVMDDRYTFAAGSGIAKTRNPTLGVPQGANYKQAIPLGACSVPNRGALQEIVKRLSQKPFFHPRSYHLVHRNCNHFAETFATAIILHNDLAEPGNNHRLKTFPDWVNRLANTGGLIVSHDDDIVPCNVLEEARMAVNAEKVVPWKFASSSDMKSNTKKTSNKQASNTKKELTEKQKAALAKIRQK